MCIRPQFVWLQKGPKFEKQEVPCRRCWACLKNRENDLIGRCLCEASTSDWVHTLTLTYDDKRLRDPSQTQIIHKTDFQHFMQRMRKRYNVRYLVAGEHGKRKGRTHFHCALFGLGAEPPARHETEKIYYPADDRKPIWDWGYTYSEAVCTPKSLRYITKYLTKSHQPKKDNSLDLEWVSYSKKPLLGHDFFVNLALNYAEERLVPYTLNYAPPGWDGKSKHSMYGKAQYVFFETLCSAWPEFAYRPKTEWLENAFKRFLTAKHLERWEQLTAAERFEATQDTFRTVQPYLTPTQKMRQGWRDYDAKEYLRAKAKTNNPA